MIDSNVEFGVMREGATASRTEVRVMDGLTLPPSLFTGPALLELADKLPVMTAFVDRQERFKFLNKPYSEWMGIARKEILGRTMREVLGDANYEQRRPLIRAALAGERKFFAATFDHPT